MATGRPILSATISASAAVLACMLGEMGIWNARSSALASMLPSMLRRSLMACSMIKRAPATSGTLVFDSGGGACSRISWLR